MSGSASRARQVWTVLETIHATVYFAPEPRQAFADLGLKGFWMGYFASRSAPFGKATPELVTATFFNFAPRMVRRALPDAWSYASPEVVLAARYASVDRLWARVAGSEDVNDAAELAERAARAADVVGRPLFGAHAALDWPAAPHLRLWHAATLLREHRGDGHVAALTSLGVDGCAAHVLAVAAGAATREATQPSRGWTDGEWEAAAARVRGRERALREEAEARTDAIAQQPLDAIGDDGVERLLELATPIARRISASGEVPYPNPIGLGAVS